MHTATITALVIPAQGQTPDDVLAAALHTQHERALVETASARKVSGLVALTITYSTAGGPAEVKDAAARLALTPCMGIDTIRVSI